jgi:hypothetical protein
MPCGLKKRDQAETIVLKVVRSKNPNVQHITLNTPFGDSGLGEDGIARRRYYIPIHTRFKEEGCTFKDFTANHMSKFKDKPIVTVADLAEAMFNDRKAL